MESDVICNLSTESEKGKKIKIIIGNVNLFYFKEV
jgi:hypothetical protein